jgi:hypothetical protein
VLPEFAGRFGEERGGGVVTLLRCEANEKAALERSAKCVNVKRSWRVERSISERSESTCQTWTIQ